MRRACYLVVLSLACTGDITAGNGDHSHDASSALDGRGPEDGAISVADARFPYDAAPDAPARLVVRPDNRAWLFYESGRPFFLCAPGDPEGFLYRGARNSDGSRSGDQLALISKLAGSGANGIYFQAIRSHGGDGGSDHNPFVDSNPALGLDQDILAEWESWFTAMDDAGIVQFFFIYDDSACVWNCGGQDQVHDDEGAFLQALVDRFEHHRFLVWVIAEEYQERFSAARVSNIAAVIRAADDYDHPIAVHKPDGLGFGEFADDPNLDQFALQYNMATASALHSGMVQAFAAAGGRYNLNMAEARDHGTGEVARKKNWAVAMGGAYAMVLGWDIANTAVADLQDCGRLVEFMERTRFDAMAPRDDLAFADTDHVLAAPPSRFILYSGSRTGDLGVRALAAGSYDLSWLDATTGNQVEQTTINAAGGDTSWPTPGGMGAEVALHVRPSGSD